MKEKNIGSDFDDFLKEEGIFFDVQEAIQHVCDMLEYEYACRLKERPEIIWCKYG